MSVTVAAAAAAALAVQETGEPVAVVLRVSEGGPAQRMLFYATGASRGTLGSAELDAAALALATESLSSGSALSRTVMLGETSHTLYVETHTPTERLIVVGAGHIAVPLAALGVMLDFSVTVLDDREEFATDERFADGVTVLRTDFIGDPFGDVVIDARTYVALVTRGHRWDFDCLTRLLERDVLPKYIGMIGSRRRVRAAFEALETAGMDRARLGRIHAPIGIDIAANTPAEIAVSIGAELVAIRRDAAGIMDRNAPTLTSKEQVLDRLLPHS